MPSYKAIAYNKSYGHQAGPFFSGTIDGAVGIIKDELRLGLKLGGPCRPCFPIQIKVWELVHTEDGITEEDL